MNKFLLVFIFGFSSFWVLAQEGIMNTDRPNVAFSPAVLGSGVVQVQSGFYTGQKSSTGIWEMAPRTTGWGLDLRIGISERLEINGYFDDSFADDDNDQRRFGAGLRYQLVSFDDFTLTAIGLVRNTIFTDLADVNRIAPQFNFSGAYAVNPTTSVGFDVGADWYASDGTPSFNYALYLSQGLGNRAFILIENYGSAYRGVFNTFFDLGLGYQVLPEFLIDVNAGLASNAGLTQYQFGAGVTWMLIKGK